MEKQQTVNSHFIINAASVVLSVSFFSLQPEFYSPHLVILKHSSEVLMHPFILDGMRIALEPTNAYTVLIRSSFIDLDKCFEREIIRTF